MRIEGALVKGGIGPEDTELGVEAPDEAGVDAGVLRRDDFAMAGVLRRDIAGKIVAVRFFRETCVSVCP